jgi:hypothetical protein
MSLIVGPIVGPLGTAAADGAAAVTDSGEGYDFAIGGLGFRLAINDERKYERATAQFRKEQYDTSDSPGDQSLLGYWTRGQLSFHKGAGQRYAELGEDTDTRYWAGVGANPFVKGEVSLYPEWGAATLDSHTDIVDCLPVGNTALAVLAGGLVTYGLIGAAGTEYPTGGVRTAVAMTTGGGSVFIATSDNKIDRVTGGVETTTYSHTTGITEVHYAKDRLFVMDADGVWYQLAPNPSGVLPVAIDVADKVFTATTEGDWAVTDTPGPVLLANGNRIFAVTQDTDGLFPTLSAPIQVADLPIGESVVGMGYYLGFVVLVTTRGVRVAALGDSGITYGPRLTEWSVDPYRTGVARKDESVFVAADNRIVEINLSSQIGDGLEFAWTDLPSPFSGAVDVGVTQVFGRVCAWGEAVLDLQLETPEATGYIETSFHRFGTLEPKRFHTVRVRTEGTKGTIGISKVLPNGTLVSLYTMPAVDGETDVTLRSDIPLDRLALRFTLNAEDDESPKLLSYQLRALPAPKRQRMIRVPLALHDVERRGTTRATGRDGSAWERLRALEGLEEESSIVTFQDFRTGESGQCYIEQVSHEGNTPPSRQSDGFGGVVWVTLRAL